MIFRGAKDRANALLSFGSTPGNLPRGVSE